MVTRVSGKVINEKVLAKINETKEKCCEIP